MAGDCRTRHHCCVYGCPAGDQVGRKRARHYQDAETAEPELESGRSASKTYLRTEQQNPAGRIGVVPAEVGIAHYRDRRAEVPMI